MLEGKMKQHKVDVQIKLKKLINENNIIIENQNHKNLQNGMTITNLKAEIRGLNKKLNRKWYEKK